MSKFAKPYTHSRTVQKQSATPLSQQAHALMILGVQTLHEKIHDILDYFSQVLLA